MPVGCFLGFSVAGDLRGLANRGSSENRLSTILLRVLSRTLSTVSSAVP